MVAPEKFWRVDSDAVRLGLAFTCEHPGRATAASRNGRNRQYLFICLQQGHTGKRESEVISRRLCSLVEAGRKEAQYKKGDKSEPSYVGCCIL
jgi:hypothetical protein